MFKHLRNPLKIFVLILATLSSPKVVNMVKQGIIAIIYELFDLDS